MPEISLRGVKIGVFGIQGSGKTYHTEHILSKGFKKPFVYLMHPEDFRTTGANTTIYIPKRKVDNKIIIDKSPEHLNLVLGKFIEDLKLKKYDGFILDEADLFLPKDMRTLQKYPNILDFIDNHRHYNQAGFIYISRRPQDITTNVVETSEYIYLFAIDGKNIKDYFKQLDEMYKDLIPLLKKDKHNYIFKRLGYRPTIHFPIKENKTIERRFKKDDERRNTNNLRG